MTRIEIHVTFDRMLAHLERLREHHAITNADFKLAVQDLQLWAARKLAEVHP